MINNSPVEYRGVAPDDASGWEEVEESDPRIAQIGGTPPEWGEFRLRMMADPGFMRLCSNIRQIAPQIEIDLKIASVTEWVPAIAQLWNFAHTLLPAEQDPTPSEVRAWRSLAASTAMKFGYDDAGHMILHA